MKKRLLVLAVLAVLIAAAAAIIYFQDTGALLERLRRYLEQTPGWIFAVLTLVLPMLGVPISLFLVLAGAKFGPLYGLLLLAALLPLQLAAMYYLGRKPARGAVDWLLGHTKYEMPNPPEKNRLLYTVTVVFLPGLAYTLKCYGLAMAGIPFRTYIGVSWPGHFLMGLPFVVLGGAVNRLNPWLLAGGAAALVALYLLVHTVTRRITAAREELPEGAEE